MEDQENRIDAPQVYPLGKTYLSNNKAFHIRDDRITCMAAGDRHSIIVTEYGRVYAFGDNSSGQLGVGHTNQVRKVSSIKSLKFHQTEERVLFAACGQESSLVATNRGVLYSFGSNDYCQLGFESEESTKIHSHPVKIEPFYSTMSWKQISMGAEHACALTADGRVYSWGSNRDGQCGQARKHDIIRKPTELRIQEQIISISCGYHHTALIDEKGRLFVFGNNSSRQLRRSIPGNSTGPLEVSFPDPVKAVACGGQHTVVLTDKGNVYTCGLGDCGQLGQGSSILLLEQFEKIENLPKPLTSIAAGKDHTVLLDSLGHMYVCGDPKHDPSPHQSHPNPFEPSSFREFQKLNVLGVVCGGQQTIILAQNKSKESVPLDSENESYLNATGRDDHSDESNGRNSSTDSKSAATNILLHPEDMSKSWTSEQFRTRILIGKDGRIVEFPSPETPITTRRNDRNYHLSKSSTSNDPVSTVTSKEDVPALNNPVLISKKSSGADSKDIRPAQQNIARDRSSSESSLSSASEQVVHRKFLYTDKSYQTHGLSDEDVYQIERQLSLSTNSSRNSSSISSLHEDDENFVSKSMDDSRLPATREGGQSDTTTNQSRSGLFSRLFGRKPSQKDSTNTSQNSRVCSLM